MRRHSRQAAGLVLALLALVARLAVACAVPSSTVSLAQATVFCHHDDGADEGNGGPAKAPDQTPDCPLCVVCFGGAATVALIPAPPPAPLPPRVAIARAALPPPSTAPPSLFRLIAHPRGPPILT